jgi:predicted nucleic-acid-binding Zn-ribbon protein
MSEPKRCPRCNGKMEMGKDLNPVSMHYVSSLKFRKTDDWIGDKIIPFYCRKCGYIELYKEMTEKKE